MRAALELLSALTINGGSAWWGGGGGSRRSLVSPPAAPTVQNRHQNSQFLLIIDFKIAENVILYLKVYT